MVDDQGVRTVCRRVGGRCVVRVNGRFGTVSASCRGMVGGCDFVGDLIRGSSIGEGQGRGSWDERVKGESAKRTINSGPLWTAVTYMYIHTSV